VGYLFKPRKKRADGTYWESRTWWCGYRIPGKTVYRNTNLEIKSKAKRQLSVWEGNRKLGNPQTDRTTIDELCVDYLTDYRVNHRRTVDQAGTYVERIKEQFSGRRAATMTAADVKDWCLELEQNGLGTATINRHLSALIRMFNLGAESGKVAQVPVIKKRREANVRKGFMGDVEHLAILAQVPFWCQVVCETAFTYGWRRGEIQGLQRNQLDFPARTIRLDPGETKNEEGRVVALTESLYEKYLALEMETRALEATTGLKISAVFHRRNGKPIKDFRSLWNEACKRAGVAGRLFHDYRRTAVRNMERARVPRSTAMKISGHKTESIYKRYAIVDQEMMAEATARIEASRVGSVLAAPENRKEE
jgi:integrase